MPSTTLDDEPVPSEPSTRTGKMLAVGATDAGDQPASFSTAGPYVAVSAPGVKILSTYPTGMSSQVNGYSSTPNDRLQ